MVVRRLDRPADARRGDRAVLVGKRVELHAAVLGRGTILVGDDVLPATCDDDSRAAWRAP